MSTARNIHVGTPGTDCPLEESVLFHFHDFENLMQVKGRAVRSPRFVCAGHVWTLHILPGGTHESKKNMMAVFICNESKTSITVDYNIITRTATGKNFQRVEGFGKLFRQGNCRGSKDYIRRETVLNESNCILSNGALTMEVRIRLQSSNDCNSKPRSTLSDSMFNLFLNKDSVDVSFEVGSQLFTAHRVILKARAPQFAQLVESCDLTKPMPLNDVDPAVFLTMLQYLYGREICPDVWKDQAKQLLEASGKYGITELKSHAEAWYVKDINLSVQNVIGELLYADGTECKLLKKVAMDFIVENGEAVLESKSYELLDESPRLRKEVMKASFTSRKKIRLE